MKHLLYLKTCPIEVASGADENTGDGAGILVQIPHNLYKRECEVIGFDLPEKGDYAVGHDLCS